GTGPAVLLGCHGCRAAGGPAPRRAVQRARRSRGPRVQHARPLVALRDASRDARGSACALSLGEYLAFRSPRLTLHGRLVGASAAVAYLTAFVLASPASDRPNPRASRTP